MQLALNLVIIILACMCLSEALHLHHGTEQYQQVNYPFFMIMH